MKIFELIRSLKEGIKKYQAEYDGAYVRGYEDCLSDLSGRIEEAVEIGIK